MSMNFKTGVLSIFLIFTGVAILNGQTPDPKPIWKFKTDGRIIGTAEPTDDVIYFGSDAGTLYAVRAADGMLVWSKETGGRIASRPAYRDGKLFVLSGDGTLHKLNAEDGITLWTFKTEGPEERYKRISRSGKEYDDIWDYYLSSPTVHDRIVFFGSSDHHIYAVDAETGELTWRYKTGNVVHSDPVADDGIVYTGSFDGFMYALDIKDGSLKWKFDTIGAAFFPEGAVQQGAEVYKGVLLFGSRDYNLYVLNKKTGKGFWNFKAESWVIGRPLVHEGKVYFGTSDSHLIYSKDIRDYRKLYWKTELPLRNLGSPVAHSSRVYVGNFDGVLYGLDIETGKIEWRFKTDGHRKNYGTVFQQDGSFQPGFSIYGETLGETATNDERLMTLGSILATPVIHSERIFFGSTDSTFYALEL